MSKRRKSKKGKAKSKFPHELTIAACHSNLEEQIITDAGFDSIDYLLALQYFPLDEIFNYWECYLDFSEIDADEVESFEELANPNLSIINDNKHAVSAINGIISFDRYFLKDFLEFTKENQPKVFWSPRKYVKEADRLSIHKATKIFAPDDDLLELELDYDEFD